MFIKSIWLGPTIIMMLYLLSSLHRAAIQAIAAYLDAFQKIADAATNSRGKFKPRTRLGCSPISRYWKYRGFPSIPPPRYCIIAFRCSLFMGLRAVGGGHRSDFYTHSWFRCLRCWFSPSLRPTGDVAVLSELTHFAGSAIYIYLSSSRLCNVRRPFLTAHLSPHGKCENYQMGELWSLPIAALGKSLKLKDVAVTLTLFNYHEFIDVPNPYSIPTRS